MISTFVIMLFALFVFQLSQVLNFESDVNNQLQNKGYISNADYQQLQHLSLTKYGGQFTLNTGHTNAFLPTSYGQKISYGVDIHLQNNFIQKVLSSFGASDNIKHTYVDPITSKTYEVSSYFDTSTPVTTTSMNNNSNKSISTNDLNLPMVNPLEDGAIDSSDKPAYNELSESFVSSDFKGFTLSAPITVSDGIGQLTIVTRAKTSAVTAVLYYDENNHLIDFDGYLATGGNTKTITTDLSNVDLNRFGTHSAVKYVRYMIKNKPDDFKFVLAVTQDKLYTNTNATILQQ